MPFRQRARARLRTASLAQSLTLIFIAATAVSAAAVPVTVFFDGPLIVPPDDPGGPEHRFGLSLASAENARDNFGIPWVTPVFLGDAENRLNVVERDVDQSTVSPIPPIGTDNTATATWRVQNVSGQSLVGSTYMVITHQRAYEVNGVPIVYEDLNVGFTIDSDLGWVLLESGGFYYPSVQVGGLTFADGEVSDPFLIQHVVNQALVEEPDSFYNLPQLQIALGFVPEPSTALLVTLGLIALPVLSRARP